SALANDDEHDDEEYNYGEVAKGLQARPLVAMALSPQAVVLMLQLLTSAKEVLFPVGSPNTGVIQLLLHLIDGLVGLRFVNVLSALPVIIRIIAHCDLRSL